VERRRPQRHSGLRDEQIDRRDHRAIAWCCVYRVERQRDADNARGYAAKQMEQNFSEVRIAARSILLPAKDASEFIASGVTAEQLHALIRPASAAIAESESAPEIAFEKQPDGTLRSTIGAHEYRIRDLSAVGLERMKVNPPLLIHGLFHLDAFIPQIAEPLLTGQALFYIDPDSLKQKLLSIAEEEWA
jgi:hypothetical protein